MADRILLGTTIDNEVIYLSKHSWDCGWHWGFGYLGNKNLHYHFDTYLKGDEWMVDKIFKQTIIMQDQWWILCDLFKQAYALKACAAIYQYGGHLSSKTGMTDVLKSDDKAKVLNDDLEIILDKIWEFLQDNLK